MADLFKGIGDFVKRNPVVVIAVVGGVLLWDEIQSIFGKEQITDVNIDMTKVTQPKEVYQRAADNTYSELANSVLYASSDKLLSFLTGLNDEELKQVYVDFGTRADNINLQDIGSKHDLFWWYQNEHGTNPLFSISDLKSRWANTGLWP